MKLNTRIYKKENLTPKQVYRCEILAFVIGKDVILFQIVSYALSAF